MCGGVALEINVDYDIGWLDIGGEPNTPSLVDADKLCGELQRHALEHH
jgi:hypothetical protein